MTPRNPTQPKDTSSSHAALQKAGLIYAFLAFGAWGLFPLYWHLIIDVPIWKILSYRILFAFVFLFSFFWNRRAEIFAVFTKRQNLKLVFLSSLLISFNWSLYIYAVNTGHVVESSLGYFINPLVSVVLGLVFLGEKLSHLKKVAVGIAAVGVAQQVILSPGWPWIAALLALSFGFYGLARKLMSAPPIALTTIETGIAAPFALIYLFYAGWEAYPQMPGAIQTPAGLPVYFLLIFGGVVTALPLVWFALATKQLSLQTLGFIQYLAPTLQFLCGVLILHEGLTPTKIVTFAFIWIALGVYSYATIKESRIKKLKRDSNLELI